jgi:hypothetical protein
MDPVDASTYSKLVQVIKCDIKLGSVERSRDVGNEAISKKTQRVPSGFVFKTPLYFLKN